MVATTCDIELEGTKDLETARTKLSSHHSADTQETKDAPKAVIQAPLVYIDIHHQSQATPALVDSGASINLCNPTRLPGWQMDYLGHQTQTMTTLQGATKRVVSFAVIRAVVNDQETAIVVCCDDTCPVPLLLGAPWLQQVEAVIDFPGRAVRTCLGTHQWVPINSQQFMSVAMMALATSSPLRLKEFGEGLTHDEEVTIRDAVSRTILSEGGVLKVIGLLKEFKDTWTGSAICCSRGSPHIITMKSNKPVVVPMRAIAQKWQKPLDDHIREILLTGALEPSESDCAAVPVCVGKPDGSLRLCIDYRKLNEQTVPDKFPLPRIDDLIQQTAGSTYFILIDLRAGFWQIPLHEDSRKWTAFRTHSGLYQWTVLPFGLINAPATFQRWVTSIFGSMVDQGVQTYIDDILIHSPSEAGLLALFQKVLLRLRESGAKAKMEKVKIAPRRLKYLGQILENGKRFPNPQRVEVLSKIARPKNSKDVRRILGATNWFRHFVPNYSEVVLPMTRLLSPKRAFRWTRDCAEALERVIEKLKTAALGVPLIGDAFRLETDASDVALGAALYSLEVYNQDPNTLPIMFLSKTLSDAERNWSTAEREAYAILWALKKTDGFVRGRYVEVITDHKNLQWMMGAKVGKLSRWTILMSEYQLVIKHRSGAQNVVADFLSRNIMPDPILDPKLTAFAFMVLPSDESSIDDISSPNSPDQESYGGSSESIIVMVEDEDEDWEEEPSTKRQQLAAPELPVVIDDEEEVILESIRQRKPWSRKPLMEVGEWHAEGPKPITVEVIRAEQEKYPPGETQRGMTRHPNGLITYLNGFWIPESLRPAVMDYLHLALPCYHPGVRQMTQMCKGQYCWPNLRTDLQSYINGCLACQRTRTGVNLPKSVGHHPIDYAFENVYMDMWGPFSWNDERHTLLTMVDHSTKWAEASFLEDRRAATVTRTWFLTWVTRFGAPRTITTDNDAPFDGDKFQSLCNLIGTKKLASTVYHPEGNSPIEVFHRSFGRALQRIRQRVDEALVPVEEAVGWALLSYRALPHTTTLHSPSFLVTGVNLHIQRHAILANQPRDLLGEGRLALLSTIRTEVRVRALKAQEVALRREPTLENSNTEARDSGDSTTDGGTEADHFVHTGWN